MSECRWQDSRKIARPQTISIGQEKAELGLGDPTDRTQRADGLGSLLQPTGIAESTHWDRRAPARPESLMSEYQREDSRKIAYPQRLPFPAQPPG